MAQDIFLHFDNPSLAGTSVDPQFKGWFEIASFSWGLQRPIGANATFHEAIITKAVELGSPTLMLWAASGKQLGKVRVALRKTGTSVTFIPEEYDLETCFITYFQNTGNIGDDVEVEELHIAATKVTYTIRYQDLNGNIHSETHFWNQSTGTGG